METPAEFEPIALWMGWEKDIDGVWWVSSGKCIELVPFKTSLTDAEVVEALNRLVEKGYVYNLNSDSAKQHRLLITKADAPVWIGGKTPTISAAVEEALLRLIAAKGGKE